MNTSSNVFWTKIVSLLVIMAIFCIPAFAKRAQVDFYSQEFGLLNPKQTYIEIKENGDSGDILIFKSAYDGKKLFHWQPLRINSFGVVTILDKDQVKAYKEVLDGFLSYNDQKIIALNLSSISITESANHLARILMLEKVINGEQFAEDYLKVSYKDFLDRYDFLISK